MTDMKKKAEDILEDYADSYSQVDLETLAKFLDQIKSEAIKEFAERLKEQMFSYYECVSESAKGRPYKGDTLMDYEVVDMIEDCIDNLVKEMAGD